MFWACAIIGVPHARIWSTCAHSISTTVCECLQAQARQLHAHAYSRQHAHGVCGKLDRFCASQCRVQCGVYHAYGACAFAVRIVTGIQPVRRASISGQCVARWLAGCFNCTASFICCAVCPPLLYALVSSHGGLRAIAGARGCALMRAILRLQYADGCID